MLANASFENATTLQGMPLCVALDDFRLNSRLRRAPRLDRRFRRDDTLGQSKSR
jgi:hypothetical protein